MRPNNWSCRRGTADIRCWAAYDAVRLHPAADQTSGFIERARGMLVASSIQQSQVDGESDQEPQFLNPQISSTQSVCAIPRIGGFDQRFEHVQGDALDAIANSELVAPRELLDRREKPQEELIVVRYGFETPGCACSGGQG